MNGSNSISVINVGIDVGGTFTDLVAFDEQGKVIAYFKVHSTPSDPSEGVFHALRNLNPLCQSDLAIRKLAHGTTIATNTLLEKKGTKTCLLTTQGFEDILELRRHSRPRMYDLFQDISPPLVPRHLRIGILERVDHNGAILIPIREDQLLEAIKKIEDEEIQAVAICFLHAYANPIHEKRAMDLIVERIPHVFVSCSHDVWPEFREYERMSTTVLDAYIKPRVFHYVRKMSKELSLRGVESFFVMKSNGGLTSAENAQRFPVHLIESGPAAGIMAATWLGKNFDFKNIITLDIGGTTAKAGIIIGGSPKVTTEFYADSLHHGIPIGGYPIKSPVIELVEISAGGGSIAWIDSAGVLKVGPQSAGALPGPACYGLGGTEPTVTDANLVLGILNPDYFHGGRTRLYPELAAKVIHDKIAKFFGWSIEEAAAAIIRIATANMTEMVRLISIRKGYDPREFSLLAYGGAGPLHAGLIAEELSIPQTIIPPLAGLFSALGLLVAGIRHDMVTTRQYLIDEMPSWAGPRIFKDLERRMMDHLKKENCDLSKAVLSRSVDLRYFGQVFELTLPIRGDLGSPKEIRNLESQFKKNYRKTYHYVLQRSRIEIVNFRLTVTIDDLSVKIDSFFQDLTNKTVVGKPYVRKVFDDQKGRFIEVPIYRDGCLKADEEILGPAIIEKEDTTIRIFEGQKGLWDERGYLIIKSKAA